MAVTFLAVQGERELRRRLRNVEGGLEDLKAEHAHTAATVLNASRPDAPRLSGRLASSGRSSGTKTAAIVRYGTKRVPYAGPVHYGWPRRHIRPHPFVIDAAQRTEPAWRAHYQATIDRLIERT